VCDARAEQQIPRLIYLSISWHKYEIANTKKTIDSGVPRIFQWEELRGEASKVLRTRRQRRWEGGEWGGYPLPSRSDFIHPSDLFHYSQIHVHSSKASTCNLCLPAVVTARVSAACNATLQTKHFIIIFHRSRFQKPRQFIKLICTVPKCQLIYNWHPVCAICSCRYWSSTLVNCVLYVKTQQLLCNKQLEEKNQFWERFQACFDPCMTCLQCAMACKCPNRFSATFLTKWLSKHTCRHADWHL